MQTTTTVHHNTGYVVLDHNDRDEELCAHEDHIDFYKERNPNSYYELWQHQTLEEAYENIFGEAIEEYNAKQTREDRKLDVSRYIKSIESDTRGKRQTEKKNGKDVVKEDSRQGKQPMYEITVTVGNATKAKGDNNRVMYDENNHHIRYEELPEELCKKVLRRYAETFQERNPNFITFDMCYHADEGFYNQRGVWEQSTPHLHIAYVPVAHDFKRGLSVQNSMNKAMKEMGFDDSRCYEKWAKKEKAILDEILYEEYEKYCKENPDFYASKGDLNIYTPVADRTREGNKTKEQYQAEQELSEKIAEAEFGIRCTTNKARKLSVIENELNARGADLDRKEKLLQQQLLQQQQRGQGLNAWEQELNARAKQQEEEEREFQAKQDKFEEQKRLQEEKAQRELEQRKKELNERFYEAVEDVVDNLATHFDDITKQAVKRHKDEISKKVVKETALNNYVKYGGVIDVEGYEKSIKKGLDRGLGDD